MQRVIACFVIAATLAACGESADRTAATPPAACAAAPAGGVVISEAWVRAAPAGRPTSAIYLTLCNAGEAADRLVGVSTDAAQAAELHVTRRDNSAIVGMESLASVELAPQTPVEFAPGGGHIMLIGLKRAIDAGDTIAVTLEFANSAAQTIEVLARAPGENEN